MESIVGELSARGYDSRWCMLSAFDCGAPHQRKRWFLLAHRNRKGLEVGSCESGDSFAQCEAAVGSFQRAYAETWSNKVDARILRMADGTSHRVDRIKAIGGGVVPLQVEKAFRLLMGLS